MVSCRYISKLIDVIPYDVLVMSWGVLGLCTMIVIVLKGVKIGLHYSLRFLLLEYLFLITSSTVLFRKTKIGRKFEFTPCWSYDHPNLIAEIIMNIAVFIPVGILLGLCFARWPWWKIVGAGCLFSVMIETLQLIFRKGFCEFDDVFHNTLGCVIGYGLYLITSLLVRRFRLY